MGKMNEASLEEQAIKFTVDVAVMESKIKVANIIAKSSDPNDLLKRLKEWINED